MNPDMNEERIGLAKLRVSDMLALADVLEVEISLDEVRKAALVHLGPTSERFAAWALNMAQRNIWAATMVLAGQVDDNFISAMAGIDVDSTKALPPHRPRRPRPTAADRRAAADRWLAGPAWKLGPEPEPLPDGGCP